MYRSLKSCYKSSFERKLLRLCINQVFIQTSMMSSTKCRLKLLSSTHKCTYKCTYNKSMNIFNIKWFMKRGFFTQVNCRE